MLTLACGPLLNEMQSLCWITLVIILPSVFSLLWFRWLGWRWNELVMVSEDLNDLHADPQTSQWMSVYCMLVSVWADWSVPDTTDEVKTDLMMKNYKKAYVLQTELFTLGCVWNHPLYCTVLVSETIVHSFSPNNE